MQYEGKRFTEVVEILRFFPVEELDKIPDKIFEYLHENKDKNYQFKFDTSKKIYEQNIEQTHFHFYYIYVKSIYIMVSKMIF